MLRNNKHHNKLLQECYNNEQLYFDYIVTETTEECIELEQQYLNEHHGTDYLVNVAKDARFAAKDLKRSDETKSKMSVAKLGKTLSKETIDKITSKTIGMKRSQDIKDKFSAIKRELIGVSVLVENITTGECIEYGSLKEASEATGVAYKTTHYAANKGSLIPRKNYLFKKIK